MSGREIALVVMLVAVWIPGLQILGEVWSQVDYASHGFLVPFVALWAATAHRARLATLAPAPLRAGPWLLALCLGLYVLALALDDATLLGLVAVATVTSALLALRGEAWVRTLRFPLAYLIFLIPLPQAWVTPLIVELQLLVSTLGVRLLQAGGVAIHREGNVLVLPGDATLFVAEACSGITSLITLLPIGVFVAYFTDHVAWRRAAIVLSVLPIALAGNLLRIVLTVLMAIEVDPAFATEGPLHEWAGVATYVIGCACLIAVGGLLRRLAPDRPAPGALDPAVT
jgi:exosortase